MKASNIKGKYDTHNHEWVNVTKEEVEDFGNGYTRSASIVSELTFISEHQKVQTTSTRHGSKHVFVEILKMTGK